MDPPISKLQAYYKAQKFAHVRTCDFDDPWEVPLGRPVPETQTAEVNMIKPTPSSFPGVELGWPSSA